MKNTALRKIVRENLDPDPLYGIILNESNDYLLIAREYDFFIDGFQILRKQDITSSISNKSNKYVYSILKTEGKLKSIDVPIIDLTNWETIFRSLGRGVFVSVEDEVAGDLIIGPIIRVNKKSMVLRYFDGAGIWCDNESIRYENL